MKRLFSTTGVGLYLVISSLGCSNTAEGIKTDADKNTAAVEKGAATAVADTKQAAQEAADKTKQAAQETADKTKAAAKNAEAATEKAAANAEAGAEKAAAEAGQVVKHAGKVLKITPKVKSALLRDETLYPTSNPGMNKIDVDTGSDGATVYLRGTVKSAEMKQRASEIAQKTLKDEKTTYKVVNELQVGG